LSVRREKEMTYVQTIAQPERTEEDIIAWLTAKPVQELRRFMAIAWVASLLSPQAIEELYQELARKEASPLEGTEEDFVEIGQD
jgi:hypothetical protein